MLRSNCQHYLILSTFFLLCSIQISTFCAIASKCVQEHTQPADAQWPAEGAGCEGNAGGSPLKACASCQGSQGSS